MPHSSVPLDRFYRHTDPALPDPVRARHVLTWCASRSAPWYGDSQTRLPPLSPANAALFTSLQGQIVKQLAYATTFIPCICRSRMRNYQVWRARRTSGTEMLRGLCWRMRNSTCLLAWNWYQILNLWFRCSHEDAAWSKVIQDYNTLHTLQSQVLSGLQKASSSPSKGRARSRRGLT